MKLIAANALWISDRGQFDSYFALRKTTNRLPASLRFRQVQPERAGRGFKESARASGATKFAPAPRNRRAPNTSATAEPALPGRWRRHPSGGKARSATGGLRQQ